MVLFSLFSVTCLLSGCSAEEAGWRSDKIALFTAAWESGLGIIILIICHYLSQCQYSDRYSCFGILKLLLKVKVEYMKTSFELGMGRIFKFKKTHEIKRLCVIMFFVVYSCKNIVAKTAVVFFF